MFEHFVHNETFTPIQVGRSTKSASSTGFPGLDFLTNLVGPWWHLNNAETQHKLSLPHAQNFPRKFTKRDENTLPFTLYSYLNSKACYSNFDKVVSNSIQRDKTALSVDQLGNSKHNDANTAFGLVAPFQNNIHSFILQILSQIFSLVTMETGSLGGIDH